MPQKKQGDSKKGLRRIPEVWFKLMPGKRLPFWVKVHDTAKRRGIRKHDLFQINKIAKEIRHEENKSS